MSEQRRVAVIGLGGMGYGMARALKDGGMKVIGCDASPEVVERFRQDGFLAAPTPAEAAVGVDIVLCAVADAVQTEAVLFGPEGVAAIMPRNAVFISCADLDPDTVRRLAARLEAEGRHYLDASVSGDEAQAVKGELTIMASGSEEAFAESEDALQIMALNIQRHDGG